MPSRGSGRRMERLLAGEAPQYYVDGWVSERVDERACGCQGYPPFPLRFPSVSPLFFFSSCSVLFLLSTCFFFFFLFPCPSLFTSCDFSILQHPYVKPRMGALGYDGLFTKKTRESMGAVGQVRVGMCVSMYHSLCVYVCACVGGCVLFV